MIVRDSIRPWHHLQGGRVGLLRDRSAAPRPRTSLVLCSKAPREAPPLHPHVRRMLEADPHLASLVKENPRLLQELGLMTKGQGHGGVRQKAQNKEGYLRSVYVSAIAQARSYSEITALLQSAVSQGAASVVTSGAAFDRLRALQARSRPGSHEELRAASQLALEEMLRRLPDADLRSLATLARAAYRLNLPVPEEEQQRILSLFISLVRASQGRHAAQAKLGPPPPKPGWVKIKLSKQGPATGVAEGHSSDSSMTSSNGTPAAIKSTAASGGSTGSTSGSAQPKGVHLRVDEQSSASRELLQDNQNIANFVWATLSNYQWELQEGQLAALMQCVQQQPMEDPLPCTQVLVGLVRYAASRGSAAVRPFTQEGGTAEALLYRILPHLSMLNRQHCSDTLMSIGMLQLTCPPGTVAALVEQALLDLAANSAQPRDAVDRGIRLRSICKLLHSLSSAVDLFPEECRTVLEQPAARGLAQEFVTLVKGPQDCEEWVDMLVACCYLGFNVPVGGQQTPLRESLLAHLPAMSTSGKLKVYQSLDVLLALGLVYGLPDRDGLAAELEPYRKSLARLARGALRAIDLKAGVLEDWRASRQRESNNMLPVLKAYASLL